jgi:hypothetical protein
MFARFPSPRGVALSAILLAGASTPALATSFNITSGTTTTAQTLNNNETGIVAKGATLKVSGKQAVAIAGGNVTINNAGTIQDTASGDRGIDTTFAAGNWNVDVINSGTLTSLDDAFRINADIGTGTVTLDNSGTILSSSSGQAIDWAAITSATAMENITNEKGGTIQSVGNDALRPGAGTVSITNDGLIDATQSASRAINLNTGTTANLKSFSLSNGVDGIIQSQGDTVRITAGTLSTSATGIINIDNFGTIKSTGVGSSNGQAIDFNDLVSPAGKITITNEATGIITAADADAVRPGTNATINNYGLIESFNGTSTSSGNDGVDFQTTGFGTVNNYEGGQIIGARHGITGDLNQTINNSGIITGMAGSGINLDTTSGTTTVVNTATGVITGTIPANAAAGQDGDGIDVDNLVNITNAGKILAVGTGTGGEINEALAIGGGTVDNGGLIRSDQRAITVDDSNLGNAFGVFKLTNEATGIITGSDGEAIMITSTLDNTITNKGIINGSVVMGSGNDALNLYTGSTINGAINGGAGTDTVSLYGTHTGTGALSNISNFEALSVQGGTWTLSGTQSFSNGVTVAAGATANVTGTLNADVTNNGAVTVHNATVAFNGTFTNNGTFASDPATQSFTNFSNGANGIVSAAAGDRFQISGNFTNTAGQTGGGNTDGAVLEFMGVSGTSHDLQTAGRDYGMDVGLTGDFKWGTLDIDAGNSITLEQGASAAQTALYVADLIGAQILGNTITNIAGAKGLIIYYDPFLAANAYLDGKNYALEDGGKLVANVPEPAGIAMLLTGLAFMGWRRRRSSRNG